MTAYTMPFRAGQRVFDVTDPRHGATVVAVFNSLLVKVRWDCTGWLSELPARTLRDASVQDRHAAGFDR